MGIDLLEVHALNPYWGFNYQAYPLDIQGWNGEEPLFKKYAECKSIVVIQL